MFDLMFFSYPVLWILVISLFVCNSNRKAELLYVTQNHATALRRLAACVDNDRAEHKRKQEQLWYKINELEEKQC